MTVFDDIPKEGYLLETDRFYVVADGFPVSLGHCLIIAKRNVFQFFDLNHAEREELIHLVNKLQTVIAEKFYQNSDLSIDGWNIGMNCGIAGGQTVMQFHCHVIPRTFGDVPNPRGGVRHCVMGKGNY